MSALPSVGHSGIQAHPLNCPNHVAIIMDGNGRWAKSRSLSRTSGHRQGMHAAWDIIFACQAKGVKVLTLFAFGIENQKRPSQEVRNLFRLFLLGLRREVNRLHQNNIKLTVIGDRNYNSYLLNAVIDAEKLTALNDGLQLNIAINYSGRWDLLQAISQSAKCLKGNENLKDIEKTLSQYLTLKDFPEPDLMIRTGGVQRLSNFILWELAYAELFFSPTLWPDFKSQ